MKRLIALVLCILVAANLSACTVSEFSDASSSSQTVDTPMPECPYITYSPYVTDKSTRENLGQDYELYCDLVDAVVNYDCVVSGFESESQFVAIWSTMRRDFVPAKKLCADFGTLDTPYIYSDGTVQLKFLLDQKEHKQILNAFAQRIQADLSIIDKEDTEVEIIAKLYHHVSSSMDYEQGSDILYDCILTNKGTSKEYAEYLMLLLNHANIECYYASGHDGESSQSWVIAKMGGQYYHFDPGWERFFGNWYWFAIDDELRRNSLASEWKTAYLAGVNIESIKGDSVVMEGRIDWIKGGKTPLPSCPEFYKKNDREGSINPWLW